jgi:hypothetical protein
MCLYFFVDRCRCRRLEVCIHIRGCQIGLKIPAIKNVGCVGNNLPIKLIIESHFTAFSRGAKFDLNPYEPHKTCKSTCFHVFI